MKRHHGQMRFPSTDRIVDKLTAAAIRLSRSIPHDLRSGLWQPDDEHANEQGALMTTICARATT